MIKFNDIHKLYNIQEGDLSILSTFSAPWKRNGTLQWRSSDTYESFIVTPTDDFKFQYWKDKDIEYRYNDYGFRTDIDFKNLERGSVFLGCSFTEGIGLPVESTWGYKVANTLNTPFINLGVAGKGVDTAYRNLVAASRKFKIDNVFLFIPPLYRQEFLVEDNEWFTSYIEDWNNDKFVYNIAHGGIMQHWSEGKIEDQHRDFFNSFVFGSHRQAVTYSFKTVQAIQSLANSIDTNFYCLGYEQFNTQKQHNIAEGIPDDICEFIPARDTHWNSKVQHLIADEFIKLTGVVDLPKKEKPVEKPPVIKEKQHVEPKPKTQSLI